MARRQTETVEPEVTQEVMQRIRDMSPEQLQALLEADERRKKKQAEYRQRRDQNLSPEQKALRAARQKQYADARRQNMTPEEKAAQYERQKEYRRQREANMTPEQKAAEAEKRKEYTRQRNAEAREALRLVRQMQANGQLPV